MTLTEAAPPVSAAAADYLRDVWWEQPHGAAATDRAYVEWEEAWDRLASDAEAGIPAALEARAVIDAEVQAAARRLRDDRETASEARHTRTEAE